MAVTAARLGFDCIFKLNGTIVKNVQDVSISMTRNTADTSTRGNEGWEQKQATTRSCSIDLTMLQIDGDPTYETFKDAFYSNGNDDAVKYPQVTLIDGKVNGSIVVDGYFTVSDFSRDEALAEAVKIKVKLELRELTQTMKTRYGYSTT